MMPSWLAYEPWPRISRRTLAITKWPILSSALQPNQLDGYQPSGQALQIPPTYQNIPLVTEQTLAVAHQLNVEIHVWTINEPPEMRRLLDLGVDGVMSDFPARLLEVVRERR